MPKLTSYFPYDGPERFTVEWRNSLGQPRSRTFTNEAEARAFKRDLEPKAPRVAAARLLSLRSVRETIRERNRRFLKAVALGKDISPGERQYWLTKARRRP